VQITIQRDRARTLRRNMTGAERKLWASLRGRALGGFRFHRQVEIGPYIVDFLCRECRVVVEVDGATHGAACEVKHDDARTAFLQGKGHVVFRAWNADVYSNLDGVLTGLLHVLENHSR
jgi:very-short-patch-repair endonuclease